MARKNYRLEYSLGKVSASQMWLMVSTEKGLSCWIDARVELEHDIATFNWSETSADSARVCIKQPLSNIRYEWLDEEGGFEFLIQISEITKELTLVILDECEDEDYECNLLIWKRQITALYRHLGLPSYM